jgi:hypothetical protein
VEVSGIGPQVSVLFFLKPEAAVCRGGAALLQTALECVFDVMHPDVGSVGEDADHVEPHGIEVWFLDVKVVFGYEAQGVLLAGIDGLEWVSEAGPAPQLYLDKDEGVTLPYYKVDLPTPYSVVTLDECVPVLDQVAQRKVFTPGAGRFIFQPPTPA